MVNESHSVWCFIAKETNYFCSIDLCQMTITYSKIFQKSSKETEVLELTGCEQKPLYIRLKKMINCLISYETLNGIYMYWSKGLSTIKDLLICKR